MCAFAHARVSLQNVALLLCASPYVNEHAAVHRMQK